MVASHRRCIKTIEHGCQPRKIITNNRGWLLAKEDVTNNRGWLQATEDVKKQ